ncbi:MAG: STAS domain-containing protein [Planctomycetes bacterium]|nr:STAS domain-containing protein [Planctomycetota bacterium]
MSGDRPISANLVDSDAPLQIEMSEHGSTVLIKVSGMAAVEVVGQFSRALQEAAARKPRLLAVDLSGLSFISSTGLGGIVAAHVTCRKNDTRMCLINPKPMIREILDLTKLSSLFEICDSLAEAEQLAGVG